MKNRNRKATSNISFDLQFRFDKQFLFRFPPLKIIENGLCRKSRNSLWQCFSYTFTFPVNTFYKMPQTFISRVNKSKKVTLNSDWLILMFINQWNYSNVEFDRKREIWRAWLIFWKSFWNKHIYIILKRTRFRILYFYVQVWHNIVWIHFYCNCNVKTFYVAELHTLSTEARYLIKEVSTLSTTLVETNK